MSNEAGWAILIVLWLVAVLVWSRSALPELWPRPSEAKPKPPADESDWVPHAVLAEAEAENALLREQLDAARAKGGYR